jgi:hypothetical protein
VWDIASMKKTNRLFKKIAFRITVLFSAVIVVTGCVSYLYLNHVYLDRTEQTLLSEADDRRASEKREDIVQRQGGGRGEAYT